jgi:hypothetical protein
MDLIAAIIALASEMDAGDVRGDKSVATTRLPSVLIAVVPDVGIELERVLTSLCIFIDTLGFGVGYPCPPALFAEVSAQALQSLAEPAKRKNDVLNIHAERVFPTVH